MTGLEVECRAVSKHFGATQALRGVDFHVKPGSVHGLAGPNGSGKSTLLKILVGIYRPAAGEVLVDDELVAVGDPRHARSLGIEMVPQELALVPSLRVWENIVLGDEPARGLRIDERRSIAAAESSLATLGLELDPCLEAGGLNPAEQRLVMVARTLHRRARLLIADEPTAGLPPEQSAAVVKALRAVADQGVSIIFVSHYLDEVAELCETATVLADGEVRVRLTGAELHRPAVVRAIAGDTDVHASHRNEARPEPTDEPALEVAALSGATLESLDLRAHRGEVVGVAGLLGSGREVAMDLIVGSRPRRGGTVRAGRTDVDSPIDAMAGRVGYVNGDRSLAAVPSWDVTSHVTLPGIRRWRRRAVIDKRAERTSAAAALKALDVKATGDNEFAGLSGGNQQRALFARWLANDVDVLVIDEPCVGVDVASRVALLEVVRNFSERAAVVLASSDPADLTAVCDRVLCLRRGRVAQELRADHVTDHNIVAAIT